MKKRIIVTAAITACLGLCAAVWPQAETVGEPPASPQTPAVSAPEPIVAEVKLETEIDLHQRKKRLQFRSQNRPRRPSQNRSQHLRKHPQSSPHRSQNLSRKCLMVSPRSKLLNRP